ncbi:MAG: DUF4280 domain-containing protein [Flavobacteriaceae bacterium]|nr:DUF4280 domain-containing protein [Flavobacteriaceae bacterium]
MPQKITDTAKLKCDKGTAPVNLAVTSQDYSTFDDKLVATEEDAKPNENIKPFGKCKLKPTPGGYAPCQPKTKKWTKTAKLDQINEMKIVLETSECLCGTGGKITIIQKGHQGIIEAEE